MIEEIKEPPLQSFCDKLQARLHTIWQDIDSELAFSGEGSEARITLRVPFIKHLGSYDEAEMGKARIMAEWVLTELSNGTGGAWAVIFCPMPRQHSDFRAPRFSHYEGTTWVFAPEG